MLKTSIQTTGFITDKTPAEYEEKFKALKEAGFDAIDFSLCCNLSSADIVSNKHSDYFDMSEEEIIQNRIKPFKESACRNNIYFGQLHAPYPTYVIGNNTMNNYIIEVVKKSLRISAFLECPYVVVHPIMLAYSLGYNEEYEANIKFYSELIPYAKKYGVTICLENMFHTKKGHLYESSCSDAQEAVHYIDKLNNIAGFECFGFCFDLGHANIVGKNIRHSLNTLGHRVKALHIHDNDSKDDLHMMPFSCAVNWGNDLVTDWEGFLNGLADIDYKGTINFETHQSFHVFPKTVHKEMLTLTCAIGNYFAQEIENRKKQFRK